MAVTTMLDGDFSGVLVDLAHLSIGHGGCGRGCGFSGVSSGLRHGRQRHESDQRQHSADQ